jgi:stearoyl-CoA desaturase (delta-9 desaturase)
MVKIFDQLRDASSVSVQTLTYPSVDVATRRFNRATDTVREGKLVKHQRRYAWATIVIPTAGMSIAVAQAIFVGVSIRDLSMCLVMYFLTLMGITVGFHRHLAHRSFKASAPVRLALAVLGSMATQGPVLHWVSNHRRHHKHSDQPGDPHSPNLYGEGVGARVRGFCHAHIGSMFAPEVTNFMIYSPDLVRDRALMFVNRTYVWWVAFGVIAPAVICGLLSMSWEGVLTGFLWGGLVRMFLVHHAIWSITSVAHMFGSKPYESRDESRNSLPLALVTGGEGWHNNHHAFPSSALFTDRVWRIDIGGIVIRILRAFGLVWDIHSVTPEMKAVKAARHSSDSSQKENR